MLDTESTIFKAKTRLRAAAYCVAPAAQGQQKGNRDVAHRPYENQAGRADAGQQHERDRERDDQRPEIEQRSSTACRPRSSPPRRYIGERAREVAHATLGMLLQAKQLAAHAGGVPGRGSRAVPARTREQHDAEIERTEQPQRCRHQVQTSTPRPGGGDGIHDALDGIGQQDGARCLCRPTPRWCDEAAVEARVAQAERRGRAGGAPGPRRRPPATSRLRP